MKLPLSWLKDYMDIDATPDEYADALTMSGSKVEMIRHMGAEIENVVTGRILSREKHPDADALWVCMVDVGGEPLQIVTGASNIEVGDIVPIAKHNSRLPGGVAIKKGKLRGVESYGMMCSHSELGIDAAEPGACEDGIFIFTEDFPPGTDVRDIFGMNEFVAEFEITSNRPDCLSVLGLARETAITFNKKFAPLESNVKGGGGDVGVVRVTVEAPDLCPRYSARVVKDISIAPSPRWMRNRLRNAGIRPINNIVDITNYILLEYGQPLHAFDLRYLEGREIRVRRAAPGESITTLDGQERTLDAQMLVIADGKRPVCVAGVMGGENSEVKDSTTEVLLESANFDKTSVRLASKRLGLRTEASSRFEKGLDAENTILAVNRACQLIEELGAGKVADGVIDVCGKLPEARRIAFNPERLNHLLGTSIDRTIMEKTLSELGFELFGDTVSPPSFRPDVEGEADIAEEIVRFYGYDKIEPTLLTGETTIGARTYHQMVEAKLKAMMAGQGYFEILTYAFTSPKALAGTQTGGEPEPVRVRNPLGEENSVMRTNMMSSMLGILSHNYNHHTPAARMFELGKVYHARGGRDKLPEERKTLAVGGYGDMDFYDIKGSVEELFDQLGVEDYAFDTACVPLLHPGRAASVIIGGDAAGFIGEVHPQIALEYEIEMPIYVAQVDFAKIAAGINKDKKYKALTKFPAISRDIAIIAEENVKVSQIEGIIKQCAGNLLEEVRLFDVYRGAQIPDGKKSVAYSLVCRAPDRTLTDKEMGRIMDKIVKMLENDLGAVLR